MPLESCMIVIDNSEYTRNGDYTPTRFQAQAQAVASVFTAKTDSNPESSVGLLSMAGKSPSLLVTPTNDIGKLLSALSRAQIGGSADLITAVQIAQLALKHRENKNARQRVVVFAGSTIDTPEDELVKLGKKLRKNNVLIDVVLFGEEGMDGEGKVGKMVEAAGSAGDCNLVVIPPGPHLLSEALQTSPILYDPERGPSGGGGGEDFGDGMDLDPNLDPELAMAIRMSLAEAAEQTRREREAAGANTSTDAAFTSDSTAATAGATTTSGDAGPSSTLLPPGVTAPLSNALVPEPTAPGDSGAVSSKSAPTGASKGVMPGNVPTGAQAVGADSSPAEGDDDDDEDMDEDEMLRRAMELSKADSGDVDMSASGGAAGTGAGEEDEDEEDEEAAIARAIAMSLEEGKKE